jgi:hypothetical protein
MSAEGRLHSMLPFERGLALEVLAGAWGRLGESASILEAVRSAAARLPECHAEVSQDFAEHVGQAAVWYLDRATRRVGDPDRDGLTENQRAANLALFAEQADADDLERLFAMAAALNADDV